MLRNLSQLVQSYACTTLHCADKISHQGGPVSGCCGAQVTGDSCVISATSQPCTKLEPAGSAGCTAIPQKAHKSMLPPEHGVHVAAPKSALASESESESESVSTNEAQPSSESSSESESESVSAVEAPSSSELCMHGAATQHAADSANRAVARCCNNSKRSCSLHVWHKQGSGHLGTGSGAGGRGFACKQNDGPSNNESTPLKIVASVIYGKNGRRSVYAGTDQH